MSTRKTVRPKSTKVQNMDMTLESPLFPDYFLFCEQVLMTPSHDSVSFINLIDFVYGKELPIPLSKFWLVATFFLNPSLSKDMFESKQVRHTVKLETPTNNVIELETFPVRLTENNLIYRLMVDISDGLFLKSEGLYTFRIFEESVEQPPHQVHRRSIFAKVLALPEQD